MGIGPWGGAALGFIAGDLFGGWQARHQEQVMMRQQQQAMLYQESYAPYPMYPRQMAFNPALMQGDPRLAYWGQRPGSMPYPPTDPYASGYDNYSRYQNQRNQYSDVLPPSPLDQDMRRETQDLADKLLCNPPDICGVMNHLRALGQIDKMNKQEHPNDPQRQTHLWYSEYLAVRNLVRQESQGQMDFQTPYQAQIGPDGRSHRVFTLLQNGQPIADSDHPQQFTGNRPPYRGQQNTPDYEGDGYTNDGGNGTRRTAQGTDQDNQDTPVT